MRRSTLLPASIVAALAAVSMLAADRAVADLPTTGQWLLNVRPNSARVDLTLRSSGSEGTHTWNFEDTTAVDRTAIRGLSDSQLASSGSHVTFRVVRDAGSFACDGWSANGRAEGTYSFTPDPAFAQGLAARGIAAPSASQSLRLAISGIDLAYVDKLRSLGIATLSPDDLVRLGDHGADAAYVEGMANAGFRFHTPDDVIRLADHGVTPAYVAAMRADGYTNLTADDFVRLVDHGVNQAYIGSMKAVGYSGLSTEDLVRLCDHGVNADFVKQMRAHGYSNLSVDDLIRLRDHGF